MNGKLVKQSMQMRFRDKPFSVYLNFAGDVAGREILFVQGKNGNQIQAHEGSGLKSLVGTVSLATDGVEAMQENRYPITMIGMRKMLETVLAQWQEETKYGEIDVKFYPEAKLGGRPCQVIESSHPQPRRQFKFHMTRLFIDAQTKLPVRVEQYGFPGHARRQTAARRGVHLLQHPHQRRPLRPRLQHRQPGLQLLNRRPAEDGFSSVVDPAFGCRMHAQA